MTAEKELLVTEAINRGELDHMTSIAGWKWFLQHYGAGVYPPEPGLGRSLGWHRVDEHPLVLYGCRFPNWDTPARLVQDLAYRYKRAVEEHLCEWACSSARNNYPHLWARLWGVWDGEPRSLCSTTRPWGLVNKAVCGLGCERAPEPECWCGLYGTANPAVLMDYYMNLTFAKTCDQDEIRVMVQAGRVHLLGLVRVWGRVVVAERGCRAEYAEPIVFVGEPDVLATLSSRWKDVPSLTVEQALEAMRRGYDLLKVAA